MRNRGHMGHLHIWQHAMSRRDFLGATARAVGVTATSGLWMPTLALADDVVTVAGITGEERNGIFFYG